MFIYVMDPGCANELINEGYVLIKKNENKHTGSCVWCFENRDLDKDERLFSSQFLCVISDVMIF